MRSMTALSSGPSASPAAARRMRGNGVVTLRSSHFARSTEAAARQHARVPLADALMSVRQRDVQLDDVMTVAWNVRDAVRRLAALQQTRQRHGGELALRR